MNSLEEIKQKLRDQILNGKKTEAPKLEVEAPKLEVEAPVTETKTEVKESRDETTREAWLESAWSMLKSHYSEKSSWPMILPEVRLSVGFARGKRPGKRLTAQTIFETEDKIPQIFVTPIATSATAVLTLLVEQVAVIRSKQTGESLADANYRCGLIAAPQDCPTTHVAGSSLDAVLVSIMHEIGTYPHAAVTSTYKPRDSGGIKLQCAKSGYKVRVAQSWLDKFGPTICPCCNEKMTVGDIPF